MIHHFRTTSNPHHNINLYRTLKLLESQSFLEFYNSSLRHILTFRGMPEAILTDVADEGEYSKLTNPLSPAYQNSPSLLYTHTNTPL